MRLSDANRRALAYRLEQVADEARRLSLALHDQQPGITFARLDDLVALTHADRTRIASAQAGESAAARALDPRLRVAS